MGVRRTITKSWRDFFRLLREAERRAGLQSLFYLAKYIIGAHWLKKGATSLWLRQHEELANWVWNLWETRKQRPYKTIAVVLWSRRTLKSTVCTGSFPVKVLLDNPNIRILIDSDTIENSQNFLQPIKQTFEAPHFKEIYGEQRSAKKWSQTEITVKRDAVFPQPSIATSGMNAETTSQHYDLIITDDLQTYGNSRNRDQINKVVDRYKLYDNLLDPGGMLVVVGTRWAQGDMMEYIKKQDEADHKAGRPRRIFINEKAAFKKNKEGKFTDVPEFPGLLDKEELAFARASQGAFLFSCNYLCSPQSDETATFKMEWIKYHSKPVSDLPTGTQIYMMVDPAGEGNFASADFNAIVVAAVTPEYDIIVLHRVRAHMTRQTLFKKILQLYDMYRPIKLGVESVFGQKELKAWLKSEARNKNRILPWSELKSSNKQKEHRIQGLQPYFEAGKIFIRDDMTDLIDELLQFPNGEHDDVIDALAYVLDFMAVSTAAQPKEFWLNRGFALEENFVPTKEFPEPPDEMSVRILRDAKRTKDFKTTNVRRIAPASRGLGNGRR